MFLTGFKIKWKGMFHWQANLTVLFNWSSLTRIFIYIKFVELEFLLMHAKFKDHRIDEKI